MPTRRLNEPWATYSTQCRDREHDPPSMQVFENGTYEHECPGCGAKKVFVVNRPTWTVAP